MKPQTKVEYDAGCTCPLKPCPIHDEPNLEALLENYPDSEFLKYDGLDAAIVGVACRCGMPEVLCYSRQKMYEIFRTRDGMTHDEAVEWIAFNIEGTHIGEATPMVISLLEELL